MEKKNQNNEIVEQLHILINELKMCEKEGRECKKCKLLKDGCLKELRNSVVVALQFISALLPQYTEQELPKIYS